MKKYLVIFHVQNDWPMTGRSDVTNCWFFNEFDKAKAWSDEKWMDDDVADIQIYEYTGIQYVLVDRRHKDV